MLITFWLCLALICYVYLGYPILITTLGWLRQRHVRAGSIYPEVSLIVCAYNEADVIGRKIENCLSLQYPADLLEVIVVNDGSTDGTQEVLKQYADRPGVKILDSPFRQGKAAAMNRAAAVAKGEVFVFRMLVPYTASTA